MCHNYMVPDLADYNIQALKWNKAIFYMEVPFLMQVVIYIFHTYIIVKYIKK